MGLGDIYNNSKGFTVVKIGLQNIYKPATTVELTKTVKKLFFSFYKLIFIKL